MEVIDVFVDKIISIYNGLRETLSYYIFDGLNLLFFALLISLIAYVIWRFYSTLSKKDFISLNLSKYNYYKHPTAYKLFALFLYFVEYLLMMPALILIWFIVFSVILLILASSNAVNQVLLLSGALVMSIRILAYFNEELSKDLAKLFPFIALSSFLLSPETVGTFDFFGRLKELPNLFFNILSFLLILLCFEIFLRITYTLFRLAHGEEDIAEKENID